MRYVSIAIVALAFARATVAHEAPPGPPSGDFPLAISLAGLPGLPGDDVLTFVSSEIGGRGVVKGAPYSATAVSETRQTLADGNRIVNMSTTRLFRDGQGRTRQEQGKGIVFINDVVAGKRFLLNSERRTARELPVGRMTIAPPPPAAPAPGAAPTPPAPPAPPAQMSGEEARSWSEAMRAWGRALSARIRAEHAAVERDVNVVVRRGDGEPPVTERIEVVRIGDGPHTGLPMPPPGLPMMTPPGPGTTTALGSRTFDGVRADGTRTTWTIAAGAIGNEKPLEITSERWYSPELLLVVQSRYADPRSGERIYRLENIKREEPPAELFRTPSDYETRPASAARAEKK